MVFNAGGVPRPGSTENPKGHYFDQVNLISEVKHKFDVDQVLKQGVTLDTYAQFLSFFPVQATVTHAADTTLDAFRTSVLIPRSRAHWFLVVNYYRPDTSGGGGGHFSPVFTRTMPRPTAWILDVSRSRSAGVGASRLLLAMQAASFRLPPGPGLRRSRLPGGVATRPVQRRSELVGSDDFTAAAVRELEDGVDHFPGTATGPVGNDAVVAPAGRAQKLSLAANGHCWARRPTQAWAASARCGPGPSRRTGGTS